MIATSDAKQEAVEDLKRRLAGLKEKRDELREMGVDRSPGRYGRWLHRRITELEGELRDLTKKK